MTNAVIELTSCQLSLSFVFFEIKWKFGIVDSWIVKKCDRLFGVLEQITPLGLVRKLCPSFETYDFTDKWVVLHTIGAFLLLGLSFPNSIEWWEWLFLIYGAWRTPSILVYLINLVLFHKARMTKGGQRYVWLTTQRTLILVLLNYVEILAWFAIFYRNCYHLFNEGTIQLCTFSGSFYYSVVTMTTLGYGDITPSANCVVWLVITQTLVGLLMVAVVLMYIVSKLSEPKIVRKGECERT